MTSIAQLDDSNAIEPPSQAADYQVPRILFADHTATLGGGEIALLNLVTHIDRSRYSPVVVLFSDGPLAQKLHQAVRVGGRLHVRRECRLLCNQRSDQATVFRVDRATSRLSFTGQYLPVGSPSMITFLG